MYIVSHITKRVICLITDDSQPGGRCNKCYTLVLSLLLITVMGLYVYFLSIYHSKVAPNVRKFASCIIAILAKALSYAFGDFEFYIKHCFTIYRLRAGSGFSSLHRPFKDKSRTRINQYYPCPACTA